MSLANPFVPLDEYLRLENAATQRSEYLQGRTFAMAGGSPTHNLIIASLMRELGGAFRNRPCFAFCSDQRVKVSATGLYTYPDIVALCGELQLEGDTLLNAQLLIEVLSESTAAYDRGSKFAHYRRVETVRDYVLISQDQLMVEHYVRQGDGSWRYSASTDPSDLLRIEGLNCEITLANIYDKVNF
jgi:Uma2 family endonuclease